MGIIYQKYRGPMKHASGCGLNKNHLMMYFPRYSKKETSGMNDKYLGSSSTLCCDAFSIILTMCQCFQGSVFYRW